MPRSPGWSQKNSNKRWVGLYPFAWRQAWGGNDGWSEQPTRKSIPECDSRPFWLWQGGEIAKRKRFASRLMIAVCRRSPVALAKRCLLRRVEPGWSSCRSTEEGYRSVKDLKKGKMAQLRCDVQMTREIGVFVSSVPAQRILSCNWRRDVCRSGRVAHATAAATMAVTAILGPGVITRSSTVG